jgi:hypothetical protein
LNRHGAQYAILIVRGSIMKTLGLP